MKYHFQFISKTSVRIELIPEDKKENLLIDKLMLVDEGDAELVEQFNKAIIAYDSLAVLVRLKFMNFPKVAICNYKRMSAQIEDVA